jgi:protein arginine N-methyltransferase 1
MYSIDDFGWMIRDEPRMQAHVKALRAAVTPGCTVLDLGAGTGIFALLACQYGAGKVYAIEPNESLILAQNFAQANGFSDRIEFFQKLSTEVSLDRKVDVIIADMRGVLPFNSENIASMIDARERFLAPGGTIIPRKDTLFAAVYSSAESYQSIENPWIKNPYGLDLTAGVRFITDRWVSRGRKNNKLLSDAQSWGEIDYRTVSHYNLSGRVNLKVHSAGTAHGISVWFDAELAEGVSISNSPESVELVYGGAHFPWPKPVALAPGDRVSLKIETRKLGDIYLWRWNTEVFPSGSDHQASETFNQSTFNSQLISPQHLGRFTEQSRPKLSLKGQVEALVISLMDGKLTHGEIAHEVVSRFPQRFRRHEEALSEVTKISRRLSD